MADSKEEQINLCQYCKEKDISHKCEQCTQWICSQCKTIHLEAETSNDHVVMEISEVTKKLKTKVEANSKIVQNKSDDGNKTIKRIENAILAAQNTEIDSLTNSSKFRKLCIKEINKYFDEIDARIREYVSKKLDKLEKSQHRLKRELEDMENACKNIKTLLDNGKAETIAEAEKSLIKATVHLEQYEPPQADTQRIVIQVIKENAWECVPAVTLQLGNAKSLKDECSIEKEKTFLEIANKQWNKQTELLFPSYLECVRIVRDQVYCCHDEGIAIYDLDLKPIRTIAKQDRGYVYDVVDLDGNDLVLACQKGLFLITRTGEKIRSIATGEYRAAQKHNGLLYASIYSTGAIQTYDPSQDWKQVQSFTPNCKSSSSGHSVTFIIVGKTITSCCTSDHKRAYSTEGGLFHTLGDAGNEIGKLNYPFLCEVDREGSALIADYSNHRLQVVSARGEWHALQLPGLQNPWRATYHNGKMYVVSYSPMGISMYTHN